MAEAKGILRDERLPLIPASIEGQQPEANSPSTGRVRSLFGLFGFDGFAFADGLGLYGF